MDEILDRAPNFLDFPEHVIAEIFSHVTHKADRRRVALTCKQFHRIIREQSLESNFLILASFEPKKAPLSLFSEIFPFSKLTFEYKEGGFGLADSFWRYYGLQIDEIDIRRCEVECLDHVFEELSTYFPALEKLTIRYYVSKTPPATVYRFPVEVLDIHEASFTCLEVNHLIRCCPGLNHLHFSNMLADFSEDYFPEFLTSWSTLVRKIEFTSFFLEIEGSVLGQIRQVKENFHLNSLAVSMKNESVENLKKFFQKNLKIETLVLDDIDEITQEHFFTLIKGKTEVQTVDLRNGLPPIDGALDTLAQMNGLKNVELEGTLTLCLSKPSIQAASKVCQIDWMTPICPFLVTKCLEHFSNLQYLKFDSDFGGVQDEILQTIIRNCPKLKYLRIIYSNLTDAGLEGFSALNRLEYLNLGDSAGITDRAFRDSIHFPNLKLFNIGCSKISIDGLQNLVKYCPNIEEVVFSQCENLNNKCLELVVEELRCIERVQFWKCDVSVDKIEEFRSIFPHLRLSSVHE